MANIDKSVVDKTWTITDNQKTKVKYNGTALTEEELIMVRSVLKNSNHPLSRILYGYIEVDETVAISNYKEVTGKGQQADRKSTRLNSSHVAISYAVFCLKKKKIK